MAADSLNARLVSIGVSKSYASELAAGVKTPGQKLAIRIFRQLGVKMGPIAHATDEEIDTLEKLAEAGKAAA